MKQKQLQNKRRWEISQLNSITIQDVRSHDEGLSYKSQNYNLLVNINFMLYKAITSG